MKRTVSLVVLMVFASTVFSQQEEVHPFRRFSDNSCFVEFLGNSYMLGSLNYERKVVYAGKFYLYGRFGAGYGIYDTKNLLSFPVIASGVFQLSNVFALELGAGTVLLYQFWKTNSYAGYSSSMNTFVPGLTGVAGIRIEARDGFLFRAGFTPVIDLSHEQVMIHDFNPWLGFSFGYCFR